MNNISILGTEYIECTGEPIGEDINCSNSLEHFYRVDDHYYYFDHHVSNYGKNGCIDPT